MGTRKLFSGVVRFCVPSVLILFTASYTHAASYQKVDGTIVDPILDKYDGNPHPYGGRDLEPYANLYHADLSGAYLSNATLPGANMSDTILHGANLNNANLAGADLTNAFYLGASNGSPYYDAETDFTDAWYDGTGGSILFDPVAAGWTLVPEPNTAILLAIGLVGLTGRRRSH